MKADLHTEPWETKCFTKDFANMIQLFNVLTENLNFSQPFRIVVDYDPEQLRTSVKVYMPKEVLESRIQKFQENCGD